MKVFQLFEKKRFDSDFYNSFVILKNRKKKK